jgi:Rod binding domain-containing protein
MVISISSQLHLPLKSGTVSISEPPNKDTDLHKAAQRLESSFIAEMLKSAGVGKTRESFGGGAGEQGFASFLVSAQADKIVEAGGFGLADRIYKSLKQSATTNA